jgi:hydrogenase maturation protease
MKPRLLFALGNSLAGDDGVGPALAARAAGDARFPPDVEVIAAGTDLLRFAPALAGRRSVLLLDAVLGTGPPGAAEIAPHETLVEAAGRRSAHSIPAVEALELLRWSEPALAGVPCTWFLVTVASVGERTGLSAPLTAALPALTERLLALLRAP